MKHRDTFEEVADLYAAHRPGYPDLLFADIVAMTGLTPRDRILEVGCGDGQATESLARLGSPILALDPGPDLVRAARAKLADQPNVAFAITPFEGWRPEPGAFKLVAAAQSWRWIDPRIAYLKAAEALERDGWLAVFGHAPLPPAQPYLDVFEEIYLRLAPELWTPGQEEWLRPEGPIGRQIAGSALFGPDMQRAYAWSETVDTAGFLALAGARSDYNLLPPAQRAALFAALAQAIDRLGGHIEVAYETHLHMAQKLD